MKTIKQRLATYKKRAQESKHEFYKDWRNCRYGSKIEPKYGTYDNGAMLWIENLENFPGVRFYKDSHDVSKNNYVSWYCDEYGDRTVSGAALVARWGKYVYVFPVVHWFNESTAQVYLKDAQKIIASEGFLSSCSDYPEKSDELESMIRDAARWADQYAESIAEDEREESLKHCAQQYCEDLREDIAIARDNVRELIKEIKQHGVFTSAICQTLRKTIREELRIVQSARESIKELTDKPYMIQEYK